MWHRGRRSREDPDFSPEHRKGNLGFRNVVIVAVVFIFSWILIFRAILGLVKLSESVASF